MFEIAQLSKVRETEFEFFCHECHTFDSLKEILGMCYEKIIDDYGGKEVPSIYDFRTYLIPLYQSSLFERYMLRDDEFEDPMEKQTASYVRSIWDSGHFHKINDALEYCWHNINSLGPGGAIYSSGSTGWTGQAFVNDIAKVLTLCGFHFHNLVNSYEFNQSLRNHNGISFKYEHEFKVNNPICEVW